MRYGTYFHGTCADHLQNILTNGMGGRQPRLWTQSYSYHTYFWDIEGVGKAEGLMKGPEMRTAAFNYAVESSYTALVRAKDCRSMILEVRMPRDWVIEDCSGPGMAEQGAVCTNHMIPARMIKRVYLSQDLSAFRSFFIAEAFSNEIFKLEPTIEERVVMRVLNDNDSVFFYRDYYDLFWDIHDTSELPKLRVA